MPSLNSWNACSFITEVVAAARVVVHEATLAVSQAVGNAAASDRMKTLCQRRREVRAKLCDDIQARLTSLEADGMLADMSTRSAVEVECVRDARLCLDNELCGGNETAVAALVKVS